MNTTDVVDFVLAADGSGSAGIRGVKTGMIRRIALIEITLPTAGSGTVQIQRDGRPLTTKTLRPRLTAEGNVDLYAGQQLDVVFNAGPANSAVHIVFHYDDISELAA